MKRLQGDKASRCKAKYVTYCRLEDIRRIEVGRHVGSLTTPRNTARFVWGLHASTTSLPELSTDRPTNELLVFSLSPIFDRGFIPMAEDNDDERF